MAPSGLILGILSISNVIVIGPVCPRPARIESKKVVELLAV